MQVSILMVRSLVGMIERAGASRDRFLELAGIEGRALDDAERRLPIADYLRALDAALAVSGDPALGLHMGEQPHPALAMNTPGDVRMVAALVGLAVRRRGWL